VEGKIRKSGGRKAVPVDRVKSKDLPQGLSNGEARQ